MSESTDTGNVPNLIETEYEIGQDNIEVSIGPFGIDIHNPVFLITGLSVIGLVFFCLIFDETSASIFGALRPWLTSQFDWVFAISMNIFVLFCFYLIISPLGKIRIGGQDAEPEYSYPSWFAMLFAAGMGIGLVFYGVLEPMNHTLSAPLGQQGVFDADGNLRDPAAVKQAVELGIAATIFHWGLHPWAVYAVVSLALAIFCYNKGLPLTVRSAFYPILGERVWGWPGHLIDTLAAIATLAGLATSLGFGAMAEDEADFEGMKGKILEESKRYFKPEFLNRLDELVVFHMLEKKDLNQIVDLEVDKLVKRLKEKEIDLVLDSEARDFLSEKGFDPAYGARPMRRAVERYLEDPLAEALLRAVVDRALDALHGEWRVLRDLRRQRPPDPVRHLRHLLPEPDLPPVPPALRRGPDLPHPR